MFRFKKYKETIKLTTSVMPIMLVIVLVFFALTSNSIISMTQTNMTLYTENCVNQLYSWTENVISELNVYKNVIENNFNDDDEKLLEFVTTTYETNDAYPMGIYIGDNTGYYADASGWVPGDDWVLVERPWYIAGRYSSKFVFGDPYMDSMLNKPCISASARLDHQGSVRVITADIYLDYAQQLINKISDAKVIDGAMFVANDSQVILADSDNHMAGQSIKSGDQLHLAIFDLLKTNRTGHNEIKADGVKYFVNIKQMDNTGWLMVTYVKKTTILGPLYKIELIMAFAAAAAAIALTFITSWYARTMNDMQIKAKTDTLTGIMNREGFKDLVINSLNENPNQGALVIFDMDNFKSINDNLGHPEGDKVLIEYAELLESFFNRKFDAVCRLGGDEFAVFIGGEISIYSIKNMLTRFREMVKDYFKKEYEAYKLSSSIGAAFAKNGIKFDELYRLADDALYEVKRCGKDSFRISHEGKYISDNSEQISELIEE